MEALLPAGYLCQRGGEHPAADLADQPHLFGQRDKFHRRDMAEHRVVPAQQCLVTDQTPFGGIDLRLVTEAQLLTADGLGQKLFEIELALQGLLHAGGETLPAQPPHLLGLIHRHVGTGDEVVPVIRIIGIDGDTDTAADGHLRQPAQLQRLGHLGEHLIGHLLRPIP